MAQAINVNPDPKRLHEAAVEVIANDTTTSPDLVKALYEEEIAALTSAARIKQYVAVIATKRVKQQLRELARAH